MDPSRVGTERRLPEEELLYSVRPNSVRCRVLADVATLARCLPRLRLVKTDVASDLGELSPDGMNDGVREGAIEGALDDNEGGIEGGRAARRSSRFHSGTSELS